jgi:hypothetical protein
MFVEPVSTSAVQIQERSPDGRMTDYNYAMSQIGHELGHRWAADARALVNGDTIALGPVHWAAGVHLPAAFPYSNPNEADAMGGSTWQENGDSTYTQLDRDYYSPAKGFSWLALYLMGFAKPEEVPPFFILRNLQRTGQQDAVGIDDGGVDAVDGLRLIAAAQLDPHARSRDEDSANDNR